MVKLRSLSAWATLILVVSCNSLLGNVEGKLVPADAEGGDGAAARENGSGGAGNDGEDMPGASGNDGVSGSTSGGTPGESSASGSETGGGSSAGGSGAHGGASMNGGSSAGGVAGSGGASMNGGSSAGGTAGSGGSAASGGSSVGGSGASAGSSSGSGGGAGVSGSGTGGTPSTCPQYTGFVAKDSAIFVNGYGTSKSGNWSGYGYTYRYGTATIAPGMGNGCFAAAKFCANGSVPASDTAGAGLGWNIAQAMSSMTPSKVAIKTAVKLSFVGVTAGMRAMLSASATVSYCYPFTAADITAGSATIPFASFKTECWSTAGTAYDGTTPIEAIVVMVAGSSAAAVPSFDFCVTDIEPG